MPPQHVIARHELSSATPKLRTLGLTCACTLLALGAGAVFGGHISKDTPHYFNTSLPIWHGRDGDFDGGVEGVDFVTCDKIRSCTDNLSAVTVFMFGLPVGQDGQSGRLGGAIAGLHGLIRLHLKAWGCPPHS